MLDSTSSSSLYACKLSLKKHKELVTEQLQLVQTAAKSSRRILQPLDETYSLLESFDTEFPKNPMAYHAKAKDEASIGKLLRQDIAALKALAGKAKDETKAKEEAAIAQLLREDIAGLTAQVLQVQQSKAVGKRAKKVPLR